MNKDIDFNSKRFLIILLIICVVFFILIIKAFEYLPNSENNIRSANIEEINRPSVTDEEKNEEKNESKVEEDKTAEEQPSKKTLNIKLPQPNDDIEIIEPPVGVNPDLTAPVSSAETETKNAELTTEQKIAETFYLANKYKTNGQYEKALGEYRKIAVLTDDKNNIAASYEGIASIYGVQHKYGTALSYATRAYNMSPSSSRELLIARLYYKTGDIDKATKRINNILHRDFTEDK